MKALQAFLLIAIVTFFAGQATAQTVHVLAGGNLQAAIDSAGCGATITLAAGVEYVGNFRLRNKGCTSANPITITTQGFSVPLGQRVTPADYSTLARILTPGNGLPVLEADSGAGWYRIVGVRLGVKYGSDPAKKYGSSFLIVIGNGGDANPNYGKWLAHDIVFDRVHAQGKFGDSRFCFVISGFRVSVINSIIDEFANPPGNDSAGFWLPNAGGHLIENNTVSAGMWMIDMGGADSDSPNRAKVVSSTTTQVMLSEMEGVPPAVGDLMAFYIRPEGGESPWKSQTNYPLGTLQFHHSNWTREVGKPPLLFYVTKAGVSGTAEPDWNGFDEYHNQTKSDGSVTWRLFNGNWQVGKVTAVSGNQVTFAPEGPTGIFLAPVVGSITKWNGYNPSVTVRRNHFLRPAHWANLNAPNKGMVQIKNAADSLFEGNFWDVEPGQSPNPEFNLNHRPGLFALTPGNQAYSAPWSTARNITFRYNRARHIESVFNWALSDYTKTSLPGGNNIAHDNLFEDMLHGFVVQANGGFNIAFRNNTVLNKSEHPLKLFNSKLDGLVYENNIVGWYQGPLFEYGDKFLQNVTGASREGGNVFVDVYNRTAEGYPPTNYFPNSRVAMSWSAVKIQVDGRLAADSPFKGKGSDGKDPGANIDLIEAAMGGTLPSPTPTPSVSPSPSPTASPTPLASPSPSPSPKPSPVPTPSTANIAGYVRVNDQRTGGVTVQVVSHGTVVASTVSRVPDGFFGFTTIPVGTILHADGATDQVVNASGTYFVNVTGPTPTPSPSPTPTPQPSPSPAPTCSMTIAPVTMPAFSTGRLIVNFSNLSGGPFSVTVVSTSGQVDVTPGIQRSSGTSAVVEFKLQSKRKSADVTVTGPCGARAVTINVQ